MPDLNPVFVPHVGREVVFQDRATMPPPFVGRSARLPRRGPWSPPATTLPVDTSGDAKVSCPIYGNDRYGDCGEAMLAHRNQIVQFRAGAGKQFNFDANALVKQYFKFSGGDNGLGEPQAIGILKEGLPGATDDEFVDALDVDWTDIPLMRFLIDQFMAAMKGWSVPNAFIQGFSTGSVWPSAMRPNPRNGHYTVVTDVAGPNTPIPTSGPPTGGGRMPRRAVQSIEGFYRDWTWGGWCWESPEFVASVRPDGFVVFSAGLYDASGLDYKGRHIAHQAQLWELAGGNPVPQSVLAKYPAAPAPFDWSAWE